MKKIKELQGANMDTHIFMAKENDFETVKDITQTTIKLVYPKYYPEGAVQFFCNHHADDRILNDIVDGKVYLFEADDVCVGTVTISNNEICRLFVLPEYQHKGYGRLLIDYAEKMIMVKHHFHGHTHTIVHTHNGVTHTHVITHEHDHNHYGNEGKHGHKHDDYMNSKEHELAHAQGM